MAQQAISHNDVVTDRHTYIGASEQGIIQGVGYKSLFRLWCEKTQKIPPQDLSDNMRVKIGTILEEPIAQLFTLETGKKVRKAPIVYTHKDYPFIKAHADRIVEGTDEGLECKNAAADQSKKWKHTQIPESYIIQCQTCMGLSGRPIWWIAALIGGGDFVKEPIEFQPFLFEKIVEDDCKFWEMVQKDIPPKVTSKDDETLKELYKNSNGKLFDVYNAEKEALEEFNSLLNQTLDVKNEIKNLSLPDSRLQVINEIYNLIAYRQEVSADKKLIEDEYNELSAKVKLLINDSEGIITPKYILTWSECVKSVIDTKQMEEDGVLDKYQSHKTYRTLQIKANKAFKAV